MNFKLCLSRYENRRKAVEFLIGETLRLCLPADANTEPRFETRPFADTKNGTCGTRKSSLGVPQILNSSFSDV